MENLDQLKSLTITDFKILKDISGIAKAKNLTELSLFVGKEFKPSTIKVLKGHPSLKILKARFSTQEEEKEYQKLKRDFLKLSDF